MHDPQEPCDSAEQENAHDFLERDHPGARLWECFQEFRKHAHEHVGESKPDACGREKQKQHGGRCGKRKTHRRAEKRRGARSAQKHEKRACEKCAPEALLAPGLVHLGGGASREPDFKDPEKAHGKSAQNHDHERDESCALELHAPARIPAAGFDGGDNPGERPEACENPERC